MSESTRNHDRLSLDRAAFRAAIAAMAMTLPAASACGGAAPADTKKAEGKAEAKGETKAPDAKKAEAAPAAGTPDAKAPAATGGADAPAPSKADGDEGPAPTEEVI